MTSSARGVMVVLALAAASMIPARAAAASSASLMADLSPEEEEGMRSRAASAELPTVPRQLLAEILAAAPGYEFDAGLLSVETDRRWFARSVGAQSPVDPILDLRRWPGDTVLSCYALAGARPPQGEYQPAIPGARLARVSGGVDSTWRWEGTLELLDGRRSAIWIERAIPDAPSRIGTLLLPGDGGLGPDAVSGMQEELMAVLERIKIRPERWKDEAGCDPGVALTLPEGLVSVGEADERNQAWQIVDGGSFTMGLPPGLRSLRMDRGVPAPRPVPGGLLWIRGRFTDRAGEKVIVGDGRRFAYVATVEPCTPEWQAGRIAPRGAPRAVQASAAAFDDAAEWTGSVAARAERWREDGFDGTWLVFRLAQADRGVEIALPIVAGRQSSSLFWIPLTWRGAGQPPAPPPVDPAERFGIVFDRFSKADERSHPWTSGYLQVPGLRVELPKSWEPSITLRSERGFPVTLVDGTGKAAGRLDVIPPEDLKVPPVPPERWTPRRRPSANRAAAVYVRDDGACLYVSKEGSGFILEPLPDANLDREVWERMTGSVSLATAPAPKGKKRGTGE